LQANSGSLGVSTPLQFYALTGLLSSFLDNAPTYLTFVATSMGQQGMSLASEESVAAFARDHSVYLVAISLGAVFFGAATYIGNGPNFMVKSIAQHAKVNTPSFFGYVIRYTLTILAPLLALTAWLFVK
jgi:Na+/H+ antiporter NhaD/arsenite permease-like protein